MNRTKWQIFTVICHNHIEAGKGAYGGQLATTFYAVGS
jgi:hypothetical protein